MRILRRGTYYICNRWSENVHVIVMNLIGQSPALFNEGIAVALAPQPIYGLGVFRNIPTWKGESIDIIAKRLRDRNEVPSLSSLIRSRDFFRHDTNITYPISGSFFKYLLNTFSITKCKRFLSSVQFENTDMTVMTKFRVAFGSDIQDVWDNWLQ